MKPDIVLLCGAPDPDYSFLSSYDYLNVSIIAVDSGLEICKKLHLLPELLVGDFDSVTQETLAEFAGVPRMKFSSRKNTSDTELAIDEAIRYAPNSITLLNASGARHDHFLFNVHLLFKYPWKASIIDVYGSLTALAPQVEYTPELPDKKTFSLIPMEYSTGLTIKGAEYPLDTISISSESLTLSNVSLGNTEISYTSGKLLLFISR